MAWKSGVILANVVVLLGGEVRAQDATSAVVGRFNAALLASLKEGDSLGYQGRFKQLEPIMRQTFDLDLMAEKALGPHWKDLSQADQARWRALFSEFTVANYAANFDRFTGQHFDILGEEPSVNDTKLVKTKVVTPGADAVELSYRLQKTGGGWRIIDVYLKGTVSELAVRRADYSSLLERDGFDALATVLRSKITDLATGRAKRDRP